jgi:multiple sugar transport system substrate-binding protein
MGAVMARRTFGIVLFLIFLLPLFITQAQSETKLSVLWMRSGSDRDDLFNLVESFIAEFEAENPGVKIEFNTVDWAEGRETILTSVEEGNPPDIAMIGARWVPELVSLNLIEPLDRFIDDDFRTRFIPSIIDEGAIYQGRTFGLPVATSTRALYYNEDLFETAGLERAPETWDELLEAGAAINALGEPETYGFGLQGGGGLETNTYFYYFVWGNGGDLYNADLSASALGQPESVEALEFLQRLIDSDATQPEPTSKAYERRADLEAMFMEGRLGMMISGPWFIKRLRSEAPDLNFGVAPLPYNTTPATYGVMDALVILQPSSHQELAWSFLQFLYDDQRRFEYAQTGGFLPELQTVSQAPEFAEDEDFSVFLSLLPDARFEPLHVQSEQIAQVVIDAVRLAYQDEDLPSVLLSRASSRINDLLTTSTSGW